MVRFKKPKTYFSQPVESGHETPTIVLKMPFPTFLSINIDMFGMTEIWVRALEVAKLFGSTQAHHLSSHQPKLPFTLLSSSLAKNGGKNGKLEFPFALASNQSSIQAQIKGEIEEKT